MNGFPTVLLTLGLIGVTMITILDARPKEKFSVNQVINLNRKSEAPAPEPSDSPSEDSTVTVAPTPEATAAATEAPTEPAVCTFETLESTKLGNYGEKIKQITDITIEACTANCTTIPDCNVAQWYDANIDSCHLYKVDDVKEVPNNVETGQWYTSWYLSVRQC